MNAVLEKNKTLESMKKMAVLSNYVNSFVALDIETTGLSPNKGGRIIELAGVKVVNGKIVDKFHQFVNPEMKIYQKTISLTGITNEMLKDQLVIGQVLPKFYDFIRDYVVVAHNAKFDWDRFLAYFFKKVGIVANNLVIDTLLLSKYLHQEFSSYKLNEMCNYYGIEIGHHHRAIDDSEATAKLFLKMKEKCSSYINMSDLPFDPLEELSRTSQKPIDHFRIFRIRYWEKDMTRKTRKQRIYVNMSIGSVYFDILTKTWYNKDVQKPIDFQALEKEVFRLLNISSIEELCQYRG